MIQERVKHNELFEMARAKLNTAVIGDILDTLGFVHQFLSPKIQPERFFHQWIMRVFLAHRVDIDLQDRHGHADQHHVWLEWLNFWRQKLMDENKTAEALALFEYYTKTFPNIVVAKNNLGDLYRKKGEKEKAITCYKAAVKVRPGNPRAIEELKKLGVK